MTEEQANALAAQVSAACPGASVGVAPAPEGYVVVATTTPPSDEAARFKLVDDDYVDPLWGA